MNKRLLALLLAFTLVLSLLPATAFAEASETTPATVAAEETAAPEESPAETEAPVPKPAAETEPAAGAPAEQAETQAAEEAATEAATEPTEAQLELMADEEEPASVEITVNLSEDANYVEGVESTVLVKQDITLTYFDLANYGLEKYYFVSSEYKPGSVSGGTAETAYNHITMLHALIYMLEVYYCGLSPEEVGQGYLKDEGLIGTEALKIEGSPGSLYMKQFWGHDENLVYYVNYEYPMATEGFGSTSDQIELWDGDEINIGMYADWSFYGDNNAGFTYIQAKGYVKQGDPLEMKAVKCWGGSGMGSGTETTPVTTGAKVYRCLRNELVTGNVTDWTYVGTADANGALTADTSDWEPGEYVVAIPGQLGTSGKTVVSSPGSAVVTVKENPNKPAQTPGDLNGDNTITAADAALLYRYINGNADLKDELVKLADMNGDGLVTVMDAAIVYRKANNKLS